LCSLSDCFLILFCLSTCCIWFTTCQKVKKSYFLLHFCFIITNGRDRNKEISQNDWSIENSFPLKTSLLILQLNCKVLTVLLVNFVSSAILFKFLGLYLMGWSISTATIFFFSWSFFFVIFRNILVSRFPGLWWDSTSFVIKSPSASDSKKSLIKK